MSAAAVERAWTAWARLADELSGGPLAYSEEELTIAMSRPIPPGALPLGGDVFDRSSSERLLMAGDVVARGSDLWGVLAGGCSWCLRGECSNWQHPVQPGWKVRAWSLAPATVVRLYEVNDVLVEVEEPRKPNWSIRCVGVGWWTRAGRPQVLKPSATPLVQEVQAWRGAGMDWHGPTAEHAECRRRAAPSLWGRR